MKKIDPTNDVCVIKPVSGETKSKGGIVIPDTDKNEKCVMGEVLAVGPGRVNERLLGFPDGVRMIGLVSDLRKRAAKTTDVSQVAEMMADADDLDRRTRLPMTVKPGDVVLFERGIAGGYEITVDGEKLFIVREICIIGKVKHGSEGV